MGEVDGSEFGHVVAVNVIIHAADEDANVAHGKSLSTCSPRHGSSEQPGALARYPWPA
jgi:hypothetical protein